ncbi:MAG: hypothetical protein ACR2OJ_06325 [Hyphomicrobiales bacterium]
MSLREAQIKALFPGSFFTVWKDKHDVTVLVKRNGALTAKYGAISMSGKWRVVGNKLCVTLNYWLGKKKRCGKVTKRGGWYVGLFRKNGKPRVRFRKR